MTRALGCLVVGAMPTNERLAPQARYNSVPRVGN